MNNSENTPASLLGGNSNTVEPKKNETVNSTERNDTTSNNNGNIITSFAESDLAAAEERLRKIDAGPRSRLRGLGQDALGGRVLPSGFCRSGRADRKENDKLYAGFLSRSDKEASEARFASLQAGLIGYCREKQIEWNKVFPKMPTDSELRAQLRSQLEENHLKLGGSCSKEGRFGINANRTNDPPAEILEFKLKFLDLAGESKLSKDEVLQIEVRF